MKLLVRLVAILGGGLLYSFVMTTFFPTEDADIGAGLIYFGLLIAVSGLWGMWDGSRAERLPPVFVRWAVVAVAVGLSAPIEIWAKEGRDFGVLWDDLAFLSPFVAGLVLAPAAVGIGIGYAIGGRSASPLGSPHQHPTPEGDR